MCGEPSDCRAGWRFSPPHPGRTACDTSFVEQSRAPAGGCPTDAYETEQQRVTTAPTPASLVRLGHLHARRVWRRLTGLRGLGFGWGHAPRFLVRRRPLRATHPTPRTVRLPTATRPPPQLSLPSVCTNLLLASGCHRGQSSASLSSTQQAPIEHLGQPRGYLLDPAATDQRRRSSYRAPPRPVSSACCVGFGSPCWPRTLVERVLSPSISRRGVDRTLRCAASRTEQLHLRRP